MKTANRKILSKIVSLNACKISFRSVICSRSLSILQIRKEEKIFLQCIQWGKKKNRNKTYTVL